MKRGFTLIELLVVIAIIGILSAIILASLNKTGGRSQSPSVGDAAALSIPAPTNYAVDTTGKLSSAELETLNAKLKAISDSGKEIAVLVIPTTGGVDIAEYGIAVGDSWKVGKSGKDNGAIIIVATEDRKIRIELGRGAEGDITDAQAGDIIRTAIAPQLKAGNWVAGINAGVDAIKAQLK